MSKEFLRKANKKESVLVGLRERILVWRYLEKLSQEL
jgi:hypothetical protein